MAASKKGGGAATRSGSRRRSAPGRARSTAAAVAPKEAGKTKQESGEKGTALLDTLYKRLEAEGLAFEKAPNKSRTYTRLRVDGKAFAYVFPPRPHSVAVKIPKQLIGVEKELPKGHGFKRVGWGLTRTISAAADVAVVAKAFKVAAQALVEADEEGTA